MICKKCSRSFDLEKLTTKKVICSCGDYLLGAPPKKAALKARTKPKTTNEIDACKHRGKQLGMTYGGCGGDRPYYDCKLHASPCWAGCAKPWPSIRTDPKIEKEPRHCGMCRQRTSSNAYWQDVEEPAVAQTNDRLLITVAVGRDARGILSYTGPRMDRYAKACGADYVALMNATQNWWGLEKFRIRHWAQHYKQVLFLDCDVWIADGCPSLFDAAPSIGSLLIHSDYDYQHNKQWMVPELESLCKSQGVDMPSIRCLNTGVVLFPGAAADIWEPPSKPFAPTHCAEQWWVERNIHARRYKVIELHRRWNHQWWMRDFRDRVYSANFIHLANASHLERIEILEQLLAGQSLARSQGVDG